jgi:hypothetical protein
MNLEEARKTIRNYNDPRTFRLIMAAAEICSPENSNAVSPDELLECLRIGNTSRRLALIAEYAAVALHARAGRPREEGCSSITEFDDWVNYLKAHPDNLTGLK